MPKPLDVGQAVGIVDEWLRHPTVVPISPTERHWGILNRLLTSLGTAGNLTMDTHLAALAIEHSATLYSTDSDFARFRSLDWINPLLSPYGHGQNAFKDWEEHAERSHQA